MNHGLLKTSLGKAVGLLTGGLARLRRRLGAVGARCAAGRTAPAYSFRPAGAVLTAVMTAALLTSTARSALAVTVDETPVINQASISGDGRLMDSSTVVFNIYQRTPAVLTFYAYRPESIHAQPILINPTEYQPGAAAGGGFTLLPSPDFSGIHLPLGEPLPLARAGELVLHSNEPLFLTLADDDQNLDPLRAETVLVTITSSTGDREVVRLTEIGPSTGVFSGYLMTSDTVRGNGDGLLHVAINASILGVYVDAFDGTDTSADAAMVDPLGTVFDSDSGQPVNGALVRLVDAATGALAAVYGDGGAACPIDQATQPFITGSQVVDRCGVTYSFDAGGYRFPLIDPGVYRLEVTAPQGYRVPSLTSNAELAGRDWWGTAYSYLVTVGSRGEPFQVVIGPAIRIDIPVDPHGVMWLQKEVNRDRASHGDFLRYRLTLQNSSELAAVREAVIDDHLPAGFRYQKGSARLNGEPLADPRISRDGRQLNFAVGSLAANDKLELDYVVEVTVGTRVGTAVNQARAHDADGFRSNLATVTVEIAEAFFRDTTFLLGRVLTGACDQPDEEQSGLAGVRIYLEDGRFVLTDKEGRYHFDGVEPGTHVVQLDTLSIPDGYELTPCEQTSQFAGRSFSQFVDLQGGTLWRVNFHARPLPAPTGEVTLALRADLEGDSAILTATTSARGVPAANLRLTLALPGGFTYAAGTSRRDGKPIDDPEIVDGSLRYPLQALAAGQSSSFSCRVRLTAAAIGGDLPVKAMLAFDTPTARDQHTPAAETRFRLHPGASGETEETRLYPRFPVLVAELQDTDRAMLEQLAQTLKEQRIARLELVGHADSQEIAERSRHLFTDNQELSVARARSVADYLLTRLDLPADRVQVRGLGDTMPIAPNDTEAGRMQNRRVELYLVSETASHPASLEVTVPASPTQSAPSTGLSVAEITRQATEAEALAAKAAKSDPTRGLLAPLDGRAVNRIEAVRIRLDEKLKPRVTIDGNEIPAERIGFSMDEPESKTRLYTYIGVDFGGPGLRLLKVEGIDPFGNSRFTQSAELTRTGDIISIRLAETAENVADGKTPVRIRVEMIDVFDRPVRSGTSLTLDGSELRPLGEKLAANDSSFGTVPSERRVEVDAQGWISFNPVSRSGSYPLRLIANDTTLEATVYVKPQIRDWILVGFAEGTVGYNILRDNKVNADTAGIDEDLYKDGQVKFFAKGAIKGEWLLTLAYDSDKPDLDGDSLFQVIDPDHYYPLYGDETEPGYEASSAENLYVKLERDQFYALFGDMQTGLTQTVLSQYSRSLNGVKSELQGERFTYTVFAADTRQAFVKDELRGDGTSGRYALTQKRLVINSEEVAIETRDRFHPERIVREEGLSRHIDYDIDYDAGTLYLKRPVPSRDENFNPVFIVVRYETRAADKANLNYGGRAAVRTLDQQVEFGASLIHEESGATEGDLYGADVTVRVTPKVTVRAEVATTEVEGIDEDSQGDAYLVEIEHLGERFTGRAWFRQQDTQFGLGQQNEGTDGMRTYGAEGAWRATPRWSLTSEAWHEDNLESDARRDVASLQAVYKDDRYGLSFGLREARDRFDDGDAKNSRQLLLGGDWSTPDRRLTLRTSHEQALGHRDESSDFPTRTMIGADYQLTQRVSLFAEQEFTWGNQEDTEGTRVGMKYTPWRGGELRSAIEQQIDENGHRIFALFGLGQSWQIDKNWSVDLSIDRSYTVKNDQNTARVNEAVPPASGGDEDFTAVSVGAAYRAEKWSWWNRLETRQADREDKVGISSGLVGEVRDGLAASARLMAFITNSADGVDSDEEELSLGFAYRPNRSKWIILERLDVSLFNEAGGESSEGDSFRIINHLHANIRASRQWQTSVYYGIKYVKESFDGDDYDGVTDMLAIETRYNLSERWDVGLHAALRHSWNSDRFDYSLGGDIGCLVMTNAWVSAGYNVVGFEDDDFDDASYTAQGPFVRMRMKFDQQSVREAAQWLNR